jgi:superfamily II RNA helicase
MVKICDTIYNNDEYEKYFQSYSFPLSDFQKHAIEGIVNEKHVLVTAHTGSGKTLPAEFSIKHFHEKKKKVIYTSPIKALSNQKYYDFTQKFPDINFGLFTGDIKTNPEADVLIMTTEILMNYLFTQNNQGVSNVDFQINIEEELGCVVFDEVHYINDEERGQVWEKTILMLPNHIQMVMLSATIDNPTGFAEWCEISGNKEVYLCSTSHRVVPLYHYGFFTTVEGVYKGIGKEMEQKVKKNINKLIPLQSDKNKFDDAGYNMLRDLSKLHHEKRMHIKVPHVLNKLVTFLKNDGKLPAICFVFSRKKVESFAKMITVPLFHKDEDEPKNIARECETILRRLPNFKEYIELPEYTSLVSLLEKGIGIHHSGMIPILREIVELMISKNHIKLLFATESFAIGLDCPIKTAVFTDINKFDGTGMRYLRSHEYTQMAGRAGRRGLDKIGYVVHLNNCFSFPYNHDYKLIMNGKPQQLVSKYRISYGLILNLAKNGVVNNFHEFSQKSMMNSEITSSLNAKKIELDNAKNKLAELLNKQTLSKTPSDICYEYIELKQNISSLRNKKRKEAERKIQQIEDTNKTIKNDIELYNLIEEYQESELRVQEDIYNIVNGIKLQTDAICNIMQSKKLFDRDDDLNFILTTRGKECSCIAEIHPIILVEMMHEWEYFSLFTTTQLVGLLSCFTDIKVSQEYREEYINCKDNFLNKRIEELNQRYLKYFDMETTYELYTEYKYETALQYDLVDIVMKWSMCEDELSCKQILRNDLYQKDISVGDFNKALLKIVTISKEFMKMFELQDRVEELQKFSLIEKYVLKYVATSQSLYV